MQKCFFVQMNKNIESLLHKEKTIKNGKSVYLQNSDFKFDFSTSRVFGNIALHALVNRLGKHLKLG